MNEYLSIVLGAIVGYALPYLIKIIIFPIKRWKSTPICGKWTAYLYWTINATVELAKMDVVIKKGILSEYRVQYRDNKSTYKGTAKIEDNNLCILMNANDTIQNSSTYHRYELSSNEKRNILFGLWTSYDGDNKISSGAVFLLKENIDDETAKNLLKGEYKINKSIPLITLRK